MYQQPTELENLVIQAEQRSAGRFALLLLQSFLNRAALEHHPQRSLILDWMRRVRQKQAEKEFEEMERDAAQR